jgi:putative transposase
MRCLGCGSAAVTERPERTAQGYRRFRCRECGRQFNERSAGLLNRTQYPSDVIALVVLWRLRYKLIPDLTDGDSRALARRGAGLIQGWRTGEFRHADPIAVRL